MVLTAFMIAQALFTWLNSNPEKAYTWFFGWLVLLSPIAIFWLVFIDETPFYLNAVADPQALRQLLFKINKVNNHSNPAFVEFNEKIISDVLNQCRGKDKTEASADLETALSEQSIAGCETKTSDDKSQSYEDFLKIGCLSVIAMSVIMGIKIHDFFFLKNKFIYEQPVDSYLIVVSKIPLFLWVAVSKWFSHGLSRKCFFLCACIFQLLMAVAAAVFMATEGIGADWVSAEFYSVFFLQVFLGPSLLLIFVYCAEIVNARVRGICYAAIAGSFILVFVLWGTINRIVQEKKIPAPLLISLLPLCAFVATIYLPDTRKKPVLD